MAYDEPGYRPPKKKPVIPAIGGVPLPPVFGALPPINLPPAMGNAVSPNPQPNRIDWRNLIESDPLYQQGLADLAGESIGDRARTLAGLRSALIRFGGKGISGLAGKLAPGWEDLLDQATAGAAGAADAGGTSLAAQLEKAHKDRLLAEEDIRASKGILSSGQTGYEIGEENQRNTIALNDAISTLLDFLSGLTGGYAGRESERSYRKGLLGDDAARRIRDIGLEPTPPPPLPNFAPIFAPVPRPQPRKPARKPGFREE